MSQELDINNGTAYLEQQKKRLLLWMSPHNPVLFVDISPETRCRRYTSQQTLPLGKGLCLGGMRHWLSVSTQVCHLDVRTSRYYFAFGLGFLESCLEPVKDLMLMA